MLTTIDLRGDKYRLDIYVGFPRDHRRLVLGIGTYPEESETIQAEKRQRVADALRGHRDCIVLLYNYEICGYAAI